MSLIGPKHVGVVNRTAACLFRRLAGRATVIVQNPLRLLPRSEPQPDLVVARFRRDFYQSAHPTAEDVLLVIEAADSSLRTDRALKLPIYARQGVIEVWIVNLAAEVMHVHTDPVHGAYDEVRTVRSGETLKPRAVPDLELIIGEILGS